MWTAIPQTRLRSSTGQGRAACYRVSCSQASPRCSTCCARIGWSPHVGTEHSGQCEFGNPGCRRFWCSVPTLQLSTWIHKHKHARTNKQVKPRWAGLKTKNFRWVRWDRSERKGNIGPEPRTHWDLTILFSFLSVLVKHLPISRRHCTQPEVLWLHNPCHSQGPHCFCL